MLLSYWASEILPSKPAHPARKHPSPGPGASCYRQPTSKLEAKQNLYPQSWLSFDQPAIKNCPNPSSPSITPACFRSTRPHSGPSSSPHSPAQSSGQPSSGRSSPSPSKSITGPRMDPGDLPLQWVPYHLSWGEVSNRKTLSLRPTQGCCAQGESRLEHFFLVSTSPSSGRGSFAPCCASSRHPAQSATSCNGHLQLAVQGGRAAELS